MLPYDLFQLPVYMTLAPIMHSIGLLPKYNGYYSIVIAVSLIHSNPNCLSAVIKEIYMDIAKIEGRHWQTVEKNIRYAIYCVWMENPNTICQFCHLPLEKPPTNKELLSSLYSASLSI